jgi:hypothetical protein
MGTGSSHFPRERRDLVEARLRERVERLRATRREAPASFGYEPSSPPSIPPGMTIAEWRAQRLDS